MDVFAHTLWTNAVFHLKYRHQRKMRYLAAFFGVVPDLIGFAPLFIYLVASGRFFDGFPFSGPQNWTFSFAENAYNYTHSLVVFALVFLLVMVIGNIYFYTRKDTPDTKDNFLRLRNGRIWFFWPLLGWLLHILIDIPTHPEFYQTPLFFPLSDIRNSHGVSWAHPVFMAVNYSLLIMAYIGLWYYQRKKYGKAE